MREILAELWEPVAAAGRVDLVDAITRPYPARVIAAVMGAPAEDAGRLHDWSMWIQRQFDPIALGDPEQLATINAKVAEFYDWVRPLIERRRGSPSDDLISALIAAEEEGDKLSGVELENLVLNILVGGVDTSQSQLAHALRLLADRPEQWAALREDPEGMAPRAVEEAVRYEPITPFTARLLTEEVEHRGVTFPAGTVITVCAFTGNRDPEVTPDPEDFDITAGGQAGAGADLRRRHPLLRRRQPGPRRDRRGARLPRAPDRDARARRRARAAERQRHLRGGVAAGPVHGERLADRSDRRPSGRPEGVARGGQRLDHPPLDDDSVARS